MVKRRHFQKTILRRLEHGNPRRLQHVSNTGTRRPFKTSPTRLPSIFQKTSSGTAPEHGCKTSPTRPSKTARRRLQHASPRRPEDASKTSRRRVSETPQRRFLVTHTCNRYKCNCYFNTWSELHVHDNCCQTKSRLYTILIARCTWYMPPVANAE